MNADGPYSPVKVHLTFREQLDLLKSRGMSVACDAAAIAALERFGYYRLAGYWHPFREPVGPDSPKRRDTFLPGASLELAEQLCEFDRKLRLSTLDAIERVEISIRVQIAYLLGKRQRYAHRIGDYLNSDFCNRVVSGAGGTAFSMWQEKMDQAAQRSKEDFVLHHRQKYGGQMPIWVAIEVWEFGQLSKFFSGMQFKDQRFVARHYGLPDGQFLVSWLRSLNFLRNVAAHHARLWNRNVVYRPLFPETRFLHQNLQHLVGDDRAQTRPYALLCILRYLLRIVAPHIEWHQELRSLMRTFPSTPLVNVRHGGFPHGWEDQPLWN